MTHTASDPDTIAGWRAVADSFLSDPCCAFHRNVEILVAASLRRIADEARHLAAAPCVLPRSARRG